MNRLRLRDRVVGVLRLQPMTIRQVARCLSVADETARRAMVRMEGKRWIVRRGFTRVGRRFAHLFKAVA